MNTVPRRSTLAVVASLLTAGCLGDDLTGSSDDDEADPTVAGGDSGDDEDALALIPELDREFQFAVHFDYAGAAAADATSLVEEVEVDVLGEADWPPQSGTTDVVDIGSEGDEGGAVVLCTGSYDVDEITDQLSDAGDTEPTEVQDGLYRAETTDYELAYTESAFVRSPAGDPAFVAAVEVLTDDVDSALAPETDPRAMVEGVSEGLATIVLWGEPADFAEDFPEVPEMAGMIRVLTETESEYFHGEAGVLFVEEVDEADAAAGIEAFHQPAVEDVDAVRFADEEPRLAITDYEERVIDEDSDRDEDSASDEDETPAPADLDREEWADVETITLEGLTAGWQGVGPALIEGQENPPIGLVAGQRYTVDWIQGDGSTHNVEIWDENEEVVDGLSTELTNEPEDTAALEFEATPEMAYYRCLPHVSMQGEIVVFEE